MAFLVAAVAFFFWKPDVIFDVNDEAVASSVADELPERLFVDPCRSLGERRWTCAVTAGEASDAVAVYKLRSSSTRTAAGPSSLPAREPSRRRRAASG